MFQQYRMSFEQAQYERLLSNPPVTPRGFKICTEPSRQYILSSYTFSQPKNVLLRSLNVQENQPTIQNVISPSEQKSMIQSFSCNRIIYNQTLPCFPEESQRKPIYSQKNPYAHMKQSEIQQKTMIKPTQRAISFKNENQIPSNIKFSNGNKPKNGNIPQKTQDFLTMVFQKNGQHKSDSELNDVKEIMDLDNQSQIIQLKNLKQNISQDEVVKTSNKEKLKEIAKTQRNKDIEQELQDAKNNYNKLLELYQKREEDNKLLQINNRKLNATIVEKEQKIYKLNQAIEELLLTNNQLQNQVKFYENGNFKSFYEKYIADNNQLQVKLRQLEDQLLAIQQYTKEVDTNHSGSDSVTNSFRASEGESSLTPADLARIRSIMLNKK